MQGHDDWGESGGARPAGDPVGYMIQPAGSARCFQSSININRNPTECLYVVDVSLAAAGQLTKQPTHCFVLCLCGRRFRYEAYGDSIVIERLIKSSGSTYALLWLFTP